ncbi:MFS transporter [Streptomyces sp. TRM 70361]|uniref:MFS transporter n=1 Tax=Streptomyces sp. TRM 70361 TaxID=3116553 RepID=UPI002E7B4EA6|nr:MFS transporter [Streptomyces sp. TRM 70361]MEE1938720.1 MFS transporter [Streptomyces sp. TRM 70361]
MPSTSRKPADPGTPGRAGYRAVFAVREFRAVFAAHVLSLLGTVVAQLALSVLVFRETGSTLLTALAFALGLLPYAVGGAVLAPLADRFPARRTLVVCDLFSAGCVAAMVLPGLPPAALLALRAAAAFVAPLFTGVRAASLGEILHGDAFVLGRSLIRIVAQAAQIAGFAAGGLLLAVVAPRTALLLTAAGFLLSAVILRLGTRERGPLARERTAGGTRVLLADRRVRALLALCWVPAAFMVVPEALAAPYAEHIGAGAVGTGLLLAALPVGAVAAEVAAGGLLGPAARERLVLPLAVLVPLPLLVYALRPGLLPALAALFLAGLGAAYTLGLDRWYLDAVPRELRGRAMTVLSAGLMSVQGLGMAAGGLVAEFVPPHRVVAGAGALGAVCVLLVVRAVRRHPVPEPVPLPGSVRGDRGPERS